VGTVRVKAVEHTILKIKEILIVHLTTNVTTPGLGSTSTEESQSLVVFTDGMLTGNINGDPVTRRSPSPTNPNDSTDTFTTAKLSPNTAASANSVKFERKVVEEIVKLFQDNNGSFYFSQTYDLTNSVERQQDQIEALKNEGKLGTDGSYWRKCDDRFFWNKVLLGDLLAQINGQDTTKDNFVLPLIQGFVEIETYENRPSPGSSDNRFSMNLLESGDIKVQICLISRRNRYRLGTRFRRRGIDDNGNVANFVETEQVIA
jgi:hypothetical protein